MLQDEAQLAAWPTPRDQDSYERRNMKTMERIATEGGDMTLPTMAKTLASWATPSQRDFKSNEGTGEFHAARLDQSRGKPLSEQAHQLSGWCTPCSQEAKIGNNPHNPYLSKDAQLTASGATPNGSPAGTEKRGQLNPSLSRWLMGLPKAWTSAR